MTKVYINGRFLSQRMTGVQRYALEVVRALDRLVADRDPSVADFAFEVLAPRNGTADPDLAAIPVRRVGVTTGHVWDQTELAFAARDGLLLSLANSGPVLHARHVVVLHDASTFANPENFSALFRRVIHVLHPLLGRAAKRVLTVSAFSRGELARHCGIPPEKMTVVPCGADHILAAPGDAAAVAEHDLGDARFVLAVGSLSPNKNFALVAEAFARLGRGDLKLAVVGATNTKVFADAGLGGTDGIVALGYVSDAELRALYERAVCLVFPSLYEGFGIPPQEAMLCGCPVIVSDTPALRETCGGAALYCDPHDPDGLARQIETLADDPARRDALKEAGLRNARRYTWTATAAGTVLALRSVVETLAVVV